MRDQKLKNMILYDKIQTFLQELEQNNRPIIQSSQQFIINIKMDNIGH